jgi:hypothetical protein
MSQTKNHNVFIVLNPHKITEEANKLVRTLYVQTSFTAFDVLLHFWLGILRKDQKQQNVSCSFTAGQSNASVPRFTMVTPAH